MRIRQRERQRSADLGAKLLQTAIFRSNLTTSLVPSVGAGGPTWARATKAWGFNELGYLEELASGCAFFGGARLVRNTVRTKSEDFSNAAWVKTNLTVTGTNVLVCSNSTADNSLNQSTDSNFPTIAGQYFRYSIRAKRVSGGVSFVQIGGSSTSFGATAFCTFSLIDGTYAAQTGVTASVTQISSDTYDFSVRLLCTTTTTGSDVFYVSMQNDLSDTRKQLFVGDGIQSFELLRAWSVDVTNYDASYVPEYVSVGVVPSPFFGAGIDGAKYFSTDYTGGRALTNLIGFRREAAATNNLMSSRDFTAQLRAAMDAQYWVASTTGTTKVTNGDFPSDTSGWTIIGAGSATVVGAKLRLDSTAAIVQANQVISGLTVGKMYQVQADITKVSGSGFLYTYIYTDSVGTTTCATRARNSTGAISYCFVAVATDQAIRLANVTVGNVWDIDNVTITECTIKAETTSTGLDGIANAATTLTATAADAIILQPVTLASAARCASAYVKRRTGTGTISFTQDGTNWTDITAQINSSTWSRVQITSTLVDPSTGFKISTIGDAIDVDCVQNEAGAEATSPIVTTTATVTRNADSLTYQTAGNIDFAVGTLYGEIQTPKGSSTRMLAQIGDGYAGITSAGTDSWRSMDGTTIIIATGLSDITTAKRKRVVSWGGATQSSCGDGIAPTSGAFDGSFGSGATISIGPFTNGYIGPVAIWNYQMTDAELQEITK